MLVPMSEKLDRLTTSLAEKYAIGGARFLTGPGAHHHLLPIHGKPNLLVLGTPCDPWGMSW